MIVLNEVEQRLAIHIAKHRYQAARSNGISNKRVGPQSDELTDLEGIAAEIAFCKLMNIYPDLEPNHRPPEDCITHKGGRVDVKATRYDLGHLLVALWKNDKPVDIYALMVGSFPVYRFAGFATAEELMKDENIRDLKHGSAYVLEQSDLDKDVDNV